jgi:hypothetical protein
VTAPPRRVLAAAVGAALLAAVGLVAVVLPAEYGIDPLGTGRALGLLTLSAPEAGAVRSQDGVLRSDRAVFELQPFESIEYKYRLEDGAALLFVWRATAPVLAELHAEADGAPEGSAESFERRRSAEARGAYLAPFPGWHGWFWENRGDGPVTVSVETSGYFRAARTYHGGHVRETDFETR